MPPPLEPPCEMATCEVVTCEVVTCEVVTCEVVMCEAVTCEVVTCEAVTCESAERALGRVVGGGVREGTSHSGTVNISDASRIREGTSHSDTEMQPEILSEIPRGQPPGAEGTPAASRGV